MTGVNVIRPTIIARIALPSILIAIGFSWFCFFPNQRLLQSKRAELEKRLLQAATAAKSSDLLNTKLTDVQSQLLRMTQESEGIRLLFDSLETRRSQSIRDSLHGTSPAKAVASTLDLLRRNSLVCFDSCWVSSSSQKEERFISAQSNVSMPSTAQVEIRSKKKYRIRLQGRFQDFRLALLQMQKEQPSVVAISIEMEASDPNVDQRHWTLVIHI